MTRTPAHVGLCLAAAIGATAALAAQPDSRAMLASVGAYVAAWERDLGSVVADEHYDQAVSQQR